MDLPTGESPDGATTTRECVVRTCGARRRDFSTRFSGFFCEEHSKALEHCNALNIVPKDMSRVEIEANQAWGHLLLVDVFMRAQKVDQGRAEAVMRKMYDIMFESFRRGYQE